MLPWYSAPMVMHGIFWMVIGHSGTCYRGTQPYGNARYFLDGNRPLWYILLRYSAIPVMYGIFYILFYFWVTPACVWCCDVSTFTEHENHQTLNLNVKYSYKDALQRIKCESIETTVRTRRLLWAGALLRMGDHRLPKRVMSGELENAGKRGPGGKEKEWTDYVADYLGLFGVTGDWGTTALDPGAWYNIVVYTKGVVGLWPRGQRKKKMRPINGRIREKRKRRTRLRLHLGSL